MPQHALHSAAQLQLTTSKSDWGATGAVETAGVMVEHSMLQPKLAIFRAFQVYLVDPRASTVSSEDELAAHVTVGWYQLEVSSVVVEVSYGQGRSEHVRH